MFWFETSMQGSHKPSFKEGGDAVNPRNHLFNPNDLTVYSFMVVSECLHPVVPSPLIRNEFTSLCDRGLDKSFEDLTRGIRNRTHSDAANFLAIDFGGNDHQFLSLSSPPTLAGLGSTDERLIYFHATTQ